MAADPGPTTQILSARFDLDEVRLLEAEKAKMESAQPGVRLSMSEVIRSCVLRAIGPVKQRKAG
jgi:hypothetical protein